MADRKLTTIYSDNPVTPSGDELIYLVDDPEGTPTPGAVDVDDLLATQHDHTVADITDLTASATELNYTDGVTSAIQTQLDGKAATSHTHTASQVTDFDTEVGNHTDVAANTAARHAAVTVADTDEIDLTLTGQQISASLKSGSIDESKLDTSVNASLDLADSATQPGDLATVATSGDYDDLINTPTLGTAAAADTGDFATSAQGAKADTALQSADIADFETTTELNARDTANRNRANHTGTQTASTISDFDTEVSNNTDVAANTADRHDSHVVGTKTVDETDIADGKTLVYNGTSGNLEYETPSGGGGGISEVVEDTSPQLGGNLDLNGNTVGDASAADLTKLSEVTATSTELNYVDGVTSAIQTQLNAKATDTDVVHDTGNETIAGVKTFSSSPVVPTPTTDMQAATKKYVDDNAGGGGGGAVDSVSVSGEAQLTGDITFSAGSNVTLTQDGNDIEIAASGGGGSAVEFQKQRHHRYRFDANNHNLYNLNVTYSSVSGGMRIAIASDSNSRGGFYSGVGYLANPTGFWDRTVKGRVVFRTIASNTFNQALRASFGYPVSGADTDISTKKTIGFHMDKDDTSLYAHSGDGTTLTRTSLTSVSLSNSTEDLVVVHDPGVNDKFYQNGTLVATHTNIPSGDTLSNASWGSMMTGHPAEYTSGSFNTEVALMEMIEEYA